MQLQSFILVSGYRKTLKTIPIHPVSQYVPKIGGGGGGESKKHFHFQKKNLFNKFLLDKKREIRF